MKSEVTYSYLIFLELVLQCSNCQKTYAKKFLRPYFLCRSKQGNEDCWKLWNEICWNGQYLGRGLLQATRSPVDSSTGQLSKHRLHQQPGPVQLSRTPLLGLASLCNSQCTGVSVPVCCPRDIETIPMIMTFMKYDGGLPMRSTHSHPIYKLLATLKQKRRRPTVAVGSVVCCFTII